MVDPDHGTISIAFIQPLGSSFIPDLLSEFQKENPGIRFQLTQNTTQKILHRIESAKIDIGFCSTPESLANFGSFSIMNQELFLIVHKDHRLANTDQVNLCEVAEDPFVLYKPETALRDVVERLCQDVGFQPKMSFEALEERTVAGLVGAKFGVALIPFFPGIDMEKVSIIRVCIPQCTLGIHMVWRTDGYMSPAVTRFKSFIERRNF